jgi:serine O-acetyltransferase
MFDNVRADLRQMRMGNSGGTGWRASARVLIQPGTIAVVNYRFGRWVLDLRIPVVRHLLRVVAGIVRYAVELLTGVHISPAARIGPGLNVHTPYGIFVGPVTIGRNCFLQHGVVISYSTRRIGDNVYFGPGAKVVGKSTIGNNVVIVANSVVLADVPDNVTVVGVPARVSFPRGHRLNFEKTDHVDNGVRTGQHPTPAAE